MRILGVDPGLGVTGYGVIEAHSGNFKLLEAGVIKSPSAQILTQRLAGLHQGIQDIICQYQPTELILEKLYSHYKHQMTAIAMAHARGVIALAAAAPCRLRLINYSAKRIKKALTGNGNASKMQVQRSVQGILKLKNLPTPADLADALALAIGHAFIMRK